MYKMFRFALKTILVFCFLILNSVLILAQGVTTSSMTGIVKSDKGEVLPGANDAARRNQAGEVLAHTANWSSNPLSKGSHTVNRPGYFTTIAHNEAKAVGNLLFAGEHTSSFYEWQGFMEGAALSGLRAASEVYSLARAR